jgi:predicted secreted protein
LASSLNLRIALRPAPPLTPKELIAWFIGAERTELDCLHPSDAIPHRRRIYPDDPLTEGGTTVPRRLATTLALSLAAFALLAATASATTITVTKAKNGKTVTLHKGDKLVVKLAANATTGYAWKVKSVDKTVLEPLTSKYVPSPNPKHLVGKGGTYKLSLRAHAKETTTLTLVYVRSFDPTHPAGSYRLRVVVR